MALVFLLLMATLVTVGDCSILVSAVFPLPKFETPPTWPQSHYYDENGPPITLSCRLTAVEGVSLLWYRDEKLLEGADDLTITDNNQTVKLEIPKQTQTGSYMCKASNLAGSVNHTGYILISARTQETRPRIIRTDPAGLVKHADIGDNITISCVFDVGGSRMALIDLANSWLRNQSQLQDSTHSTYGINVSEDNNQVFSLTISNFQVSDYGEYVCYGENQLGNDSEAIAVLPKPPNEGHFQSYIIVGASIGGVFVIGTIVMALLLIKRKREWNKYEALEWQEPDLSNIQVPEHDVQYDVFISYSSNDLNWAKDVLFQNLVANGYNVCIDFKDFTPGMAISENIIDAIYKSRHTIVLLSKNFLRSMWGQFELQQAHNRAIMQRRDGLIIIRFDQCKVPVKLMGKTFLDWTDKKVKPHFWQRLFEAIGEPSHSEEPEIDHQDTDELIELMEELQLELKDIDNEDNKEEGLHDSGIGQDFPTHQLQESDNEFESENELAHNKEHGMHEDMSVLKIFVDPAKSNNEINKYDDDGIEVVNEFPNVDQGKFETIMPEEHEHRVKSHTGEVLEHEHQVKSHTGEILEHEHQVKSHTGEVLEHEHQVKSHTGEVVEHEQRYVNLDMDAMINVH